MIFRYFFWLNHYLCICLAGAVMGEPSNSKMGIDLVSKAKR